MMLINCHQLIPGIIFIVIKKSFNQLDLPEYPSKDILIEKLMMAIMEGKEGFGFA